MSAAEYTILKGGIIYDPLHGICGEQRDLCLYDGRITRNPPAHAHRKKVYDVSGKVLMAGAIDLHTHIGGGKVNIARMMLPEDHGISHHNNHCTVPAAGGCAPGTLATGWRYAEMGYTACFEPAMLPANARQTHFELADTPIVDKGAYAVLGNDDYLLRMLTAKKSHALINDYVAWIVQATKAPWGKDCKSGRNQRIQIQPTENGSG